MVAFAEECVAGLVERLVDLRAQVGIEVGMEIPAAVLTEPVVHAIENRIVVIVRRLPFVIRSGWVV